MNTALKYGFLIFIAIQVYILISGKRSNENDIPQDLSGDSVVINKVDTYKFNKPDTTPYKGNWVDIN